MGISILKASKIRMNSMRLQPIQYCSNFKSMGTVVLKAVRM